MRRMTKRFEWDGRNKAEYTKTRRCCRNAPLILYILPYFYVVVGGAVFVFFRFDIFLLRFLLRNS